MGNVILGGIMVMVSIFVGFLMGYGAAKKDEKK